MKITSRLSNRIINCFYGTYVTVGAFMERGADIFLDSLYD